MKTLTQHQRNKQLEAIAIGVLVVSLPILMAACDRDTVPNSSSTVQPTATHFVASADARKQIGDAEAYSTIVAARTMLALSPVPSHPIGPPPTGTPYPSPTLAMNVIVGCQTAGGAYTFSNCWRGIVDGRLISVGAGMAQTAETRYGVVVVADGPYLPYAGPIDDNPSQVDVYRTPSELDQAQIASVSAPFIILTQAYPQGTPTYFVFDLTTRQFVVQPPYPTLTLIMGMLPRCNTASAIPYVLSSCWRGYLNRDVVNVGAGRINNTDGSSYGAIVVRVGFELTFFNHDNPPVDVYPPPTAADDVQIVAVNGTVFTIAPLDTTSNVTWLFDLSTRQWLNALGTPLPTLTPAPTVGYKQ